MDDSITIRTDNLILLTYIIGVALVLVQIKIYCEMYTIYMMKF